MPRISVNSTNPQDLIKLREAYEAHGDAVYTFCVQLVGNRSDAEDIAAETFLHASRALLRFEERSSVRTYLYRIAVNRWRSFRRACKTTLPLDPELVAGDVGIHDRIAVAEALDKLPIKLRESLVLVKGHGFSHREAGQILRVPIGTVQSRVFEAIKQMRHHLAGFEFTGCPREATL
jgi:RNA polymerase sigma-70 factor, ECF subfamily